MIKGIIFDLDGTLLNTLYDLHNCVNLTLKEFNYPCKSLDEVRSYVGVGFRNLIKSCLPEGIDDQTIDLITARYRDIYHANPTTYTKPYDGMIEVIDKLNKKGILLAVNSNKSDELSNIIVNYYYPGNKFIKIIGYRDGLPLKPDPYTGNELLSLMNINKEEALYIGDSGVDIKTAKNLGVKSIGCAWGFRGRDVLIEQGANIVVDNPKQILDYLD